MTGFFSFFAPILLLLGFQHWSSQDCSLMGLFGWHFLVLAAKNEEDVFLCLQGLLLLFRLLQMVVAATGPLFWSSLPSFFSGGLSLREKEGEIPLSIVIYASFFPFLAPLTYLDLSAPNVTRARTVTPPPNVCAGLRGCCCCCVVAAVVVNLSLLLLFQPHICPLLCFRTG